MRDIFNKNSFSDKGCIASAAALAEYFGLILTAETVKSHAFGVLGSKLFEVPKKNLEKGGDGLRKT